MTMRNAISPASLLVGYLQKGKWDEDKQKFSKHVTDGEGMFIEIDTTMRTGDWMLQFKCPESGKRTHMKLGECHLMNDGKTVEGMSVAEARVERARAQRIIKVDRKNPAGLRDAERAKVAQDKADERAQDAERIAFDKANRARVAAGKKALARPNSFAHVAELAIEHNVGRMSAISLAAWKYSVEKYCNPLFGDKHINEVTRDDIADLHTYVMEKVKKDKRCKSGHHALIQARRYARHTFDWALDPDRKGLRTEANPVYAKSELWDDIPDSESHAALIDEEGMRELVLAVRASVPAQAEWDLHGGRFATPTVVEATRFALLVGQRPENVAECRKAHLHLDDAIPTWVIPAIEMKGQEKKKRRKNAKPHIVFLSSQAVALLRAQIALHPNSDYVFPGQFAARGGHMNPGSINEHLARLGFKDRQTGHGMRASMRTAGKVFAGCEPVIIEMMLAHKKAKEGAQLIDMLAEFMAQIGNGGMPGVYDREAQLLQSQKRLALRCQGAVQKWADWLDHVASDAWRIEQQERELEDQPLPAHLKVA